MEKLFLKTYRYTHSVAITKILEGEYFSSEGIYSIQEHHFSFIWMAAHGTMSKGGDHMAKQALTQGEATSTH